MALVALAATLEASSAGATSRRIPSKTSAITVTQLTEASLSISWQRVRNADGYDLYLNGASIGKTQATTYTFSNLRCGSTYTLGVDAFNNKGVRSAIVNVVAGTGACPGAPVGNDTSPPTSPISLIQGATTARSISLLWAASLDNVGVSGYELFLNGSKVGTTTATNYTFANLGCGTSYTLAVDAFDAAGNRSQSAVVQASTSPCADTSPPTIPAVPTQTGSTATSISLLWAASLDNVGVSGYELFLNGSKVGTTTATNYTFANLGCGTSYTLAVDAFDAAGNRSQRSSVSGTTSACATPTAPPTSGNCTATLNPSSADTLDTQFNDPSKGDVVCLHGGDYGSPSVFTHLTRSGTSSQRLTLQSVPGETAVIHGYLAIDSNWITLAHIKIDVTTTPQGTSSNCPGQSIYGNFTLAGSNIVVEKSEITASNQTQSGNGIYVTGSNEEIQFNKIHDVGACRPYDHGIYLSSGSGTQIHDNWLWNLPDGWGVQVYPTAGDDHIYANVIDRAMSGFVVCSTGSNTVIDHNIVMNSAAGSLISGCGPQGSSTGNAVNDNDSFNNAAGFGNVANVSMAGNFSADPRFVDPASHNYQVSPTSPLLSWDLWTGS
jgi:chitodextrinase